MKRLIVTIDAVDEDGEPFSRRIPANSVDEAEDIFNAEHPKAEMIGFDEEPNVAEN